MLIDWFTVSAQVVNFLLLLYLLKRFLYAPILQAMDKREQAISDRMTEAEKAQVDAEKNATDYLQKQQLLEGQRERLLAAAEKAAEQHSKKLFAQAKDETEKLRSSWSEAVQREQTLFLSDLKKRVAAETLRISRKLTAELTGVDLQSRLVAVLLEKLQRLQKTERNKCVEAAIKAAPEVQSAFALDATLEKKLTLALQDLCASDLPVVYSTDAEMLFGIDVTIGELKFSWGIESYFKELEENISELLGKPVQLTASSLGAHGDG